MVKYELEVKDILYKAAVSDINEENFSYSIPEYEELLEKMKTFLSIDSPGYNIYLIDEYSEYRIETILNYIRNIYANKDKQDLCYVVMEDEKTPEAIVLSKGKGVELKSSLEDIQSNYSNIVYDFYSNNIAEKNTILKEIQEKRNELIDKLINMAKDEGFQVKATSSGFTFVPIKDEKAMLESEYDLLDPKEKEKIADKVSELKEKANDILDSIKLQELEGLQKIKEVLLKYLMEEANDFKIKYFTSFEDEKNALNYLKFVCDNIERSLVDIYTTSFDEDEEKLHEAIYKYSINLLIDNRNEEYSNVNFEDDPTLTNLMGNIEYENINGNYLTDINHIKAGSFLESNGGCLILRAADLFSYKSSYFYLKKALISEKVKFDHSKNYLGLLPLNSINPKPIEAKVKVIIIGDYETYDILYNMDEDFRRVFKIRLEYDANVNNNEANRRTLAKSILWQAKEKNLTSFHSSAIEEIFRFLSKRAENKSKLLYDEVEINKIIMCLDSCAKRDNKKLIKGIDVKEALYEKDYFEKRLHQGYKESRILLPIEDKLVGSVNGLSVIDLGYTRFGRPIRITCSCHKGDGYIIDAQKEGNLSGNIHNKSVSILTGLINQLFGGYNTIPIDFHISFEQVYGKVEGDSASVAEIVSIISALSKIAISQNIAVTGSINQFGEIQSIGGINEKIEGFFDVCKLKGTVEGKGVLLPKSNVTNIVLRPEVEEAVEKGIFKLYVMESLEDAITVLMGDSKLKAEDILDLANKEVKKYSGRGK